MRAAMDGHLPCVQTLLDHGALTDLKNWNGDTALMMAAEYNNIDVVVSERCEHLCFVTHLGF